MISTADWLEGLHLYGRGMQNQARVIDGGARGCSSMSRVSSCRLVMSQRELPREQTPSCSFGPVMICSFCQFLVLHCLHTKTNCDLSIVFLGKEDGGRQFFHGVCVWKTAFLSSCRPILSTGSLLGNWLPFRHSWFDEAEVMMVASEIVAATAQQDICETRAHVFERRWHSIPKISFPLHAEPTMRGSENKVGRPPSYTHSSSWQRR